MSDLAFHKLFSEICFYFVFLSIAAYWENSYVLLLVSAISCGLAAYFSSKCKSFISRAIIGLLPIMSLLLAENPIQLIGVAVVMTYTFIICASGKFYLPYWTYKPVFGVCAVAYGIFLLIVLSSPLNSFNATLYGLLFLVNGIIGLRRTRMGAGLDVKGKVFNALEVIGVCLAGATGMLVVYFVLVNSTKIVEVILMPFALLFFGIGSLAVKLGSLFKYTPPEANEVVEQIEEVEESTLEQFSQQVEETTKKVVASLPENFWKIVVLVLFALLILFLIYKLTQAYSDKPEESVVFGKVDAYFENRKRRKGKLILSNSEKIRVIYKDYLKLIKRKGVVLKKSSTSEDALLKAQTIVDEDLAEKLRELYILARYADEERISDNDVSLAKQYFDGLIAYTSK